MVGSSHFLTTSQRVNYKRSDVHPYCQACQTGKAMPVLQIMVFLGCEMMPVWRINLFFCFSALLYSTTAHSVHEFATVVLICGYWHRTVQVIKSASLLTHCKCYYPFFCQICFESCLICEFCNISKTTLN